MLSSLKGASSCSASASANPSAPAAESRERNRTPQSASTRSAPAVPLRQSTSSSILNNNNSNSCAAFAKEEPTAKCVHAQKVPPEPCNFCEECRFHHAPEAACILDLPSFDMAAKVLTPHTTTKREAPPSARKPRRNRKQHEQDAAANTRPLTQLFQKQESLHCIHKMLPSSCPFC